MFCRSVFVMAVWISSFLQLDWFWRRDVSEVPTSSFSQGKNCLHGGLCRIGSRSAHNPLKRGRLRRDQPPLTTPHEPPHEQSSPRLKMEVGNFESSFHKKPPVPRIEKFQASIWKFGRVTVNKRKGENSLEVITYTSNCTFCTHFFQRGFGRCAILPARERTTHRLQLRRKKYESTLTLALLIFSRLSCLTLSVFLCFLSY